MKKKVIIISVIVLLIAVVIGAIFFITNKDNVNGENETTEQLNESVETNVLNNTNILENQFRNEAVLNNTNTLSNETLNPNVENGKILVLYFSRTGNTEAVANIIHNEVGGDILEIETVEEYPEAYSELSEIAENEKDNNARPEIKTEINIEEYDTIFLGCPIWFADMPMVMYSFLDNYDLSGKTIAPFVTSGGSGLCGVPDKIRQLEPNANVLEGIEISGSTASTSNNEIQTWINSIGF